MNQRKSDNPHCCGRCLGFFQNLAELQLCKPRQVCAGQDIYCQVSVILVTLQNDRPIQSFTKLFISPPAPHWRVATYFWRRTPLCQECFAVCALTGSGCALVEVFRILSVPCGGKPIANENRSVGKEVFRVFALKGPKARFPRSATARRMRSE